MFLDTTCLKACFRFWLDLSFSPTIGAPRMSARSIIWTPYLFITWDTNSGPLLLCRDPGSQNLGIIFLYYLATLAAVSGLVENASTHPENISTSTKKYLKLPDALAMTVTSAFQSFPGYVWLVWWALSGGGGGVWCWSCSLCRWGTSQPSDWWYFSHLELPWSQLMSYIELPSHNEFLYKPPWKLDKLKFEERSITHVH